MVLWVITLLAVLATGFVAEVRSDMLITRNNVDQARVRAVADAGVSFAVLGVLSPPALQWRADGSAHEISLDGVALSVRLEDEHGKLDLNVAPLNLLQRLFEAFDAKTAPQVMREVAAQRAGGGFLSVAELRVLTSVTAPLFKSVSGFLTVHSGRMGIEPATAAVDLLRAVSGLPPADIEAVVAARRRLASDPAAPTIAATVPLVRQSPLRVFTVVAEARVSAHARFVRKAIVTLTGDPQAPYRVLTWEQAGLS